MKHNRTPARIVRRTALALVAAAVLTLPALVLAHDGHAHTVRGTITEVTDKQVTILQTDKKVVVVKLDDKTTLLKGEQKVKASELAVGQRVIADVGDGKTPLLAKSIKLGVVK